MTDSKVKGTQTEQALINSFAGESQARNRYTYFASIAKKEGYEQIAGIFLETADNEREHAKIYYKHLGEGVAQVNGIYPFSLGTTYENLMHAAAGEKEEWSILYYNGAKIAEEEGFKDVADSFWHIREVEMHHEARYLELANVLNLDQIFKKPEETPWICRNCGYIYHGNDAPMACPACKHPRAYFQVFIEKF